MNGYNMRGQGQLPEGFESCLRRDISNKTSPASSSSRNQMDFEYDAGKYSKDGSVDTSKPIIYFLLMVIVVLVMIVVYLGFPEQEWRERQQTETIGYPETPTPPETGGKDPYSPPPPPPPPRKFPTRPQLSKISKLLDIDISNNYVQRFSSQQPEDSIQEINRVLAKASQFVVVVKSVNQQEYVFGVYGNNKNLRQSAVFSLNRGEKVPIQKNFFLMELDYSYQKGPKFGKLDISLFQSKQYYNSRSHFCYSFKCPKGVEYNSNQAKTYLAGRNQFHVDHLVIFSRKDKQLNQA